LACCLICAGLNPYLFNLEWAMLVVDLLIFCVALYSALHQEGQLKLQQIQLVTNQVKVAKFLVSKSDFHKSDQALFHVTLDATDVDGFRIVAESKPTFKISKKGLTNL
jgi:hypothetical protein